jgi:hypothetical protein
VTRSQASPCPLAKMKSCVHLFIARFLFSIYRCEHFTPLVCLFSYLVDRVEKSLNPSRKHTRIHSPSSFFFPALSLGGVGPVRVLPFRRGGSDHLRSPSLLVPILEASSTAPPGARSAVEQEDLESLAALVADPAQRRAVQQQVLRRDQQLCHAGTID